MQKWEEEISAKKYKVMNSGVDRESSAVKSFRNQIDETVEIECWAST